MSGQQQQETILTLIDLQKVSDSTSTTVANSVEFNWLKTKFRKSPDQTFSLKFEKLVETNEMTSRKNTGYCYDIVLSYSYQVFIIHDDKAFHIYHYNTKQLLKTIKTEFEVHKMEIDNDHYLYASLKVKCNGYGCI